MPLGPDASNACLPEGSPVIYSTPPVPSTTRGERCPLDGEAGRLNASKSLLGYPSGKSIVIRNLDESVNLDSQSLPVLVYRGHNAAATTLKIAPSGAYVASGDERGRFRVWALDHNEHLCKYDQTLLTGPIKDAAWDFESKRVALAGERSDPGSDCAKVVQWDTGVSVGQLSQHLKGRVAAIAFKPNRPMRIVTAGSDDTKLHFHAGPPFQKVPSSNNVPAETCHTKGAVMCVRYNASGSRAVSVGSDRSICVYEGKTLEFQHKLEQVHAATIYSVAWSADEKHILTASGDGTCKLFAVADDGSLSEEKVWNPAEKQLGKSFDRVPVGGGQVGCAFVNGNKPVSVGLNGQITLLDDMSILTGHSAPIAGLAMDLGRGVFYTGDTDGLLCQWDVKTGKPIRRLEPAEGNADLMFVVHTGAISGLAATGNGSLLSVGWDDKMNIADASGQLSLSPLALAAQPTTIASGTNLAVIVTVQGLLLVKDGKAAGDIISIPFAAQAACITKDDSTVYVGGDDCKIHVYKVDGGSLNEVHVIESAHLKPIHAFALSNDESKLASADVRDVCVWDLKENYKALIGKGRWCFHVQRVTCLSWSPDDQVIASGGADDSIYLWSLAKKMKRVHYPYAHRGGLTGLSFVNDGYKFVSVGVDAAVNVWDVEKDVKEKLS